MKLTPTQQVVVERVADFLVAYANRCRKHKNDISECEAMSLLRALGPEVVLRLHSDSWMPLLPPEEVKP